jgi:rRNA-processing protein FCF1
MASDRLRGNPASKIVVFDSSAILMLFEYSINLNQELIRLLGSYEIVVPSKIVEELKVLSEKGKGKKKQLAKPALKLIENYKIVFDKSEKADDAVLNIAKKLNGVVFSNDKELKDRAKKEKIKTIFMRNKKYLMISEDFV